MVAIKKTFFVFMFFLIPNVFAVNLYLRATSGTANWSDYNNWSTDPLTYKNNNQLFPSSSDTINIDGNSFQNAGDVLFINIPGAECKSFNIDNLAVTMNHSIKIPTGINLSIQNDCMFSNKTNLMIEGTLKLGTGLYGNTAGMGFSGANLNTSGGGELIFDGGGFNGGSSVMNIIGDLLFENGKISIIAGTVACDGKKILCKEFSVLSAINSCAIDFENGTELEVTGDLKLWNSNLTHSFATKNTKIKLSNNGVNQNKLNCDNCDFSASDLEIAPGAKYDLGYQTNKDLYFNEITIGDTANIQFNNQYKKLSFNSIYTNSIYPAGTFFYGAQTSPPNTILEDRDGGNICLFDLGVQYWNYNPTSSTDFIYVSDNISLNPANLVGNFIYKDKGIGHIVSAVGNLAIASLGAQVKLYKESSIGYGIFDIIDSSDAPNGNYQFNPNNYNKGGKYLINATVASTTGNLPGYYTRNKNGNDSVAAFLWENAYKFNYDNIGCYVSIEDTIVLAKSLNVCSSCKASISGTINYQFTPPKLAPSFETLIGNGQTQIKVGLGTTPPGKIVAMQVTTMSGTNGNIPFSFTNLPVLGLDSSYYVMVDIPGLNLITYHDSIKISSTDSVTKVDFKANDTIVYIENKPVLIRSTVNYITALKNIDINPNPFVNSINISFDLPKIANQAEFQLMNLLGEVVYRQALSLQANQNSINIDVGSLKLSNGTYIASIFLDHERYSTRLIKQ